MRGIEAAVQAVTRTTRAAVEEQSAEQGTVRAVDGARRSVTVALDAGGELQLPYLGAQLPYVGTRVTVGGSPGARHVVGIVTTGAGVITSWSGGVSVRNPADTDNADLHARDLRTRDIVATRDINAQEDVIAGANMACTSLIADLDINARQDLIAGANVSCRSLVASVDAVVTRDISAGQDVIAGANMACKSLIADIDIHARKNLIATANVSCTSVLAGLDMIAQRDINAKQDLIAGANVACRSLLASLNVEVQGSVGVVYTVSCTTLRAYVIEDLPSSRHLKRDIAPVDESALEAIAAAPVYWWRYKPDAIEDLDSKQWRKGPMVDDLPADAVTEPDDGNGPRPELISMVHYAWQAIRELNEKVDSQQTMIEALTARLDALEGTPA